MENAIDSALVKENGNGVYVVERNGRKEIVVVYDRGFLTDWLCCWTVAGAPFFVGNVSHSKTTKKAIYSLIRKHISDR